MGPIFAWFAGLYLVITCCPWVDCHLFTCLGMQLLLSFMHWKTCFHPFFLLILFYFYLFLIYIYINSVAEIVLPYFTTEITTSSSPFALSLAKHLRSVGAKMYGAFWCSHCLEQKQVHLPPFICFCSFLSQVEYRSLASHNDHKLDGFFLQPHC